jgi:hypothetical protein
MAKKTPFFKFDSAAWLGGSIQFTSLECKGLFIDLCALYWDSQKPVKIDIKFKVRIRLDEGTLSEFLGTLEELSVIVDTEEGYVIPFLDKLMEERQDFLQKCSAAGRKSKGTSSNKKEERRKKSVESRKKKEESREEKTHAKGSEPFKIPEVLKTKYPMPEMEYQKFEQYWNNLNQVTDCYRWQEDSYFDPATKLASWRDRLVRDGSLSEEVPQIQKAPGFL